MKKKPTKRQKNCVFCSKLVKTSSKHDFWLKKIFFGWPPLGDLVKILRITHLLVLLKLTLMKFNASHVLFCLSRMLHISSSPFQAQTHTIKYQLIFRFNRLDISIISCIQECELKWWVIMPNMVHTCDGKVMLVMYNAMYILVYSSMIQH